MLYAPPIETHRFIAPLPSRPLRTGFGESAVLPELLESRKIFSFLWRDLAFHEHLLILQPILSESIGKARAKC